MPQQQTNQARGPVGDGDYRVRDGDCLSSIAEDRGLFWETVWNDPANAEVKRVREDPNVLLPGDRLTLHEIRPKQESGATEIKHRFRKRGTPAKLRLRLLQEPEEEHPEDEVTSANNDPQARESVSEDPESNAENRPDEPRANVPYTLIIDGRSTEGTTDADGRIDVPIPPNARRGILRLNPGTDEEEEIDLNLGHLSPISQIIGVKERLANLSFDCGDRSDEMTEGLRDAVEAFQLKHGMEPTGELTDAVRDRIEQEHGS